VGGIEITVCFPGIAVELCFSTQPNVDTQITLFLSHVHCVLTLTIRA